MGEVQSDDPKVENPCVYDPNRECPVRKEIGSKLDAKDQVSKYVKPLGDEELMKIYAPLIEKLQQAFQSELGILHFYCAQCPIRFKEMK